MGAEGFHGRVRDGIGWFSPRCGHQAVDPRGSGIGGSDIGGQKAEETDAFCFLLSVADVFACEADDR